MINAPKNNISPLSVSKYGKSTKRSTQRHHQVNEDKRALEAEKVQALGTLRSLQCKKKLAAEKRQEMLFLRNEEKEKWINDYAERETAEARQRVDDTEAAVQQEQHETRKREIMGLTNWEAEHTVPQMMVAIGDCLSNLASSNDGEVGEDEDDVETEQGNMSEDDEPSWLICTISNTVHQHLERFWQKQMKLDMLSQPGWEDAADYFN